MPIWGYKNFLPQNFRLLWNSKFTARFAEREFVGGVIETSEIETINMPCERKFKDICNNAILGQSPVKDYQHLAKYSLVSHVCTIILIVKL